MRTDCRTVPGTFCPKFKTISQVDQIDKLLYDVVDKPQRSTTIQIQRRFSIEFPFRSTYETALGIS